MEMGAHREENQIFEGTSTAVHWERDHSKEDATGSGVFGCIIGIFKMNF